jgi:hypothetical protein
MCTTANGCGCVKCAGRAGTSPDNDCPFYLDRSGFDLGNRAGRNWRRYLAMDSIDWTEVMAAAAEFEADPTPENLVRLSEAREALRQAVVDAGGQWMPPTKH